MPSTSAAPIVSHPFGVVGLGGFASGLINAMLVRKPHRPFQLTHVYDPNPAAVPDLVARLHDRNIILCDSLESLLASPIEAVWLPVPIDLHRPFTEQALRAGKAVLCEKPAAGCVQDVDAMIAARDAANLPVAIGFQDIYTDSSLALKTRILGGAIGSPKSATLMACWPRDSRYYARPWAAKLKYRDAWILDSPANNALAHYINLALFFLGHSPQDVARPLAVEAELYRANAIENFDTCSLRIHLAGGIPLTINLTHACLKRINPILTIHGDRESLVFDVNHNRATLGEEIITLTDSSYENTLRGFERLIFEPASARPYASLEMARTHSLIVSAVNQIAPVRPLAAPFVQVLHRDDTTLHHFPGIEDTFAQATAREQMLHESALLPWTYPARRMDLNGYSQFTGPASA